MGPSPVRILWPNNLQRKIFVSPATKLDFPHLYLLTSGLLCVHAKAMGHSSFTCFTDSALLEMIMHKGRDKKCLKTLALIKAIFMIHLDALPTFSLSRTPSYPEARTINIPAPVLNWLRHMRQLPAEAMSRTLTADNVIPPL